MLSTVVAKHAKKNSLPKLKMTKTKFVFWLHDVGAHSNPNSVYNILASGFKAPSNFTVLVLVFLIRKGNKLELT